MGKEGYVMEELVGFVSDTVAEVLGRGREEVERLLAEPPRHTGWDLSFPLMRFRPDERVSYELVSRLREHELVLDARVERGYLNVGFDKARLAERVLEEVDRMGPDYGARPTRDEVVVVEHTSANPVHPLHVGHGRNMALGDSLARLLRLYGYRVQTRFYVNDLGRQVAVLAYGVRCLGDAAFETRGMKRDHWFGLVYALTNQLLELKRLKAEREGAINDPERYAELTAMIDEVVANVARLSEGARDVFERLTECVMGSENPEEEVDRLMAFYEFGDPSTVELVRMVVNAVLEGFRETMRAMGVNVDVWDYESDLQWSGAVGEVLRRAQSNPLFARHKGAEALALDRLASLPEVREKLRIPAGMEVPPLIIRRSDGTSLYVTRDIAYTIRKFEETGACRVINVIAKEQMLAQAQLRLALYALGYARYAENLVHYSYEMVLLPGRRMSGRAGVYVSLDEMLKELEALAERELTRRYGGSLGERLPEYARSIAASALRYSLVSVEPDKQLIFRHEEVLDFERNTAPYLLYTYARACGILRKASIGNGKGDVAGLVRDEPRYRLVKALGSFPLVLRRGAEELRLEYITAYLWRLAQDFNHWYDSDPVLKEADEGLRVAKLRLVNGVRAVLAKGLWTLGVEPLERL